MTKNQSLLIPILLGAAIGAVSGAFAETGCVTGVRMFAAFTASIMFFVGAACNEYLQGDRSQK